MSEPIDPSLSILEKNRPPVAFISGCSGYIGKHIAEALLLQGWVLWGLTRNKKKAIALNSKVNWIEADLAKTEILPHALNSIPKEIKWKAIIHCAGHSPDHTILNLNEKEIELSLKVNFHAVKIINDCLWQQTHKPCSIIHFGSRIATKGNIGQIAYSSAKNLLADYTKVLASSGGNNQITVNLIYPGVHPSAILGEHAEQVLFNAKKDSYLKTLTNINDVVNAVLYLTQAFSVSGQTFAIESRPIE